MTEVYVAFYRCQGSHSVSMRPVRECGTGEPARGRRGVADLGAPRILLPPAEAMRPARRQLQAEPSWAHHHEPARHAGAHVAREISRRPMRRS